MVLNWQAPTMIKGILKALSNMLSLVDVMASAKCLGVDTFHDKWRLHCLFIPVVMMLIPLGLWLKDEGRAENPGPALASLTSRSFFVVFFCYPRICKFTFDVFIVHRVADDVEVLVEDDRVLYQDDIHGMYVFGSWVLIMGFCFAVPLGAAVLLCREYQRLPPVEPALQARVSQAFQISLEDAEAAVNDIAMGNKYGFLTAAFRPKFFYNESLDMVRKLLLVGIILVVRRGSVGQAMVSLCLSVFFLALQAKNWPYKIDWDNRLRMATEAHVCLTIAVALAFCSNLDSDLGPAFGADDPDGLEALQADIEQRKRVYDWLLVSTFIACVPGALVVTMLAKIKLIQRVLHDSATTGMAHGTATRDDLMRFRYERFRLGLAADGDSHELADFLTEARLAEGAMEWPANWAIDPHPGSTRPQRGEVRDQTFRYDPLWLSVFTTAGCWTQIELTPKQHKDEFWEVFRKLRAPPLAAVPTLTGNADGPGPKVARDGQKSAEVGMTDAWMVKLQRIQVRIPAVGMGNGLQPW